ncbi:MAG: S41 family peptidase [Acidobacteriota bacterium]
MLSVKYIGQSWERVVQVASRLRDRSAGWTGLLLILLAAISGRIYQGAPIPDPPGNSIADNPVVKYYGQMVDLVNQNYYLTPHWESLTKDVINRMLHTLDPHSNFYDFKEFAEMQNEQNSRYYGIGAGISQRNNRIYIVDVSPRMPADRAGIKYGDAIVEVDGRATDNWADTDVLSHVRGDRGSAVEITVERAGASRRQAFRIERDEVPYLSVRHHYLIRPGIGYIDLKGGFNQETSNELRQAIAALKNQGMERLLLDLRRNPGGLLKQAIEVSEIFLPPGNEIVSIRGREGRVPQRSYVSANQLPESMPLALLIDEGTASASEILAGALQDYGRAWIIGEQSFGKGLVQTVYRLRGGTGLVLTTARYFTPKGRSIQRSYSDVNLYDYERSRRLKMPIPLLRGGLPSGGIRPDQEVGSGPDLVTLRDACFQFARQVSAGLIPDLVDWEVRQVVYNHRLRGPEFQVTSLVRRRFRDFIQLHPEWQLGDSLLAEQRDYIDRQIRAEMIATAFGTELAEQYLLQSDRQALRAIEWLNRQGRQGRGRTARSREARK